MYWGDIILVLSVISMIVVIFIKCDLWEKGMALSSLGFIALSYYSVTYKGYLVVHNIREPVFLVALVLGVLYVFRVKSKKSRWQTVTSVLIVLTLFIGRVVKNEECLIVEKITGQPAIIAGKIWLTIMNVEYSIAILVILLVVAEVGIGRWNAKKSQ